MPEPDAIRHPHDALFRAALGDPARTTDLLRTVLPADLVATIDWASLRRIDASFVDDDLRAGQADLLFAAEASARELLIYLLLEHKSGDDRYCSFQLLRYQMRIWEQVRRERPRALLLPPILPFVLHHGPGPWRSPRSLRELIDLDGLPASLVALQPQSHFVLDDLGDDSAGDLQSRRLAVQTLLPLLHLQQLRRQTLAATLITGWRHLYRRLLAAPGGQDLVAKLISYVVTVSQDDLEDLRSAYARISKPTEEQFMTTAQKLIQQGLLQGHQEGRQEGRQLGLQEGRVEILLTLLRERFGDLPQTTVVMVQSGALEDLDRWARRILSASTLEQVFAR